MYPDKELETRIDRYIDRIEAAQMTEPTGYLETYTLLKEPEHRWETMVVSSGGNTMCIMPA